MKGDGYSENINTMEGITFLKLKCQVLLHLHPSDIVYNAEKLLHCKQVKWSFSPV